MEGIRITWVQGIMFGVLVSCFPEYGVLVGGLSFPLVPILGWYGEVSVQAVAPVIFFLLAVMVHPVRVLWLHGADWATCFALLGSPRLLGFDWLAGLGGWSLVEAAAAVAGMQGAYRWKRQNRKYRERAEALRAEWQIGVVEET